MRLSIRLTFIVTLLLAVACTLGLTALRHLGTSRALRSGLARLDAAAVVVNMGWSGLEDAATAASLQDEAAASAGWSVAVTRFREAAVKARTIAGQPGITFAVNRGLLRLASGLEDRVPTPALRSHVHSARADWVSQLASVSSRATETAEREEILADMWACALVAWPVLAILCVWFWFRVLVAQRLRALGRVAQGACDGNLQAPIEVGGQDEIATLASSVREMACCFSAHLATEPPVHRRC